MNTATSADARLDLLQSLSAALQTTPLMSRLYDPDHTLSNEAARQLVESLERLAIVVTMAVADPQQSLAAE